MGCLPCFGRQKRTDVSSAVPTNSAYVENSIQIPHRPSDYTQSSPYITAPTASIPRPFVISSTYSTSEPDYFSSAISSPTSLVTGPSSYSTRTTSSLPQQPHLAGTSFHTYSATTHPLVSFPLRNHPICLDCSWIPRYRDIVSPLNENSNVNRPYFICIRCKSNPKAPVGTNGRKGWITWDDALGVVATNPPCVCRSASRQDRAGVNSRAPGYGFWTCAAGTCRYLSWRRDGLPEGQADQWGDSFKPWLI